MHFYLLRKHKALACSRSLSLSLCVCLSLSPSKYKFLLLPLLFLFLSFLSVVFVVLGIKARDPHTCQARTVLLSCSPAAVEAHGLRPELHPLRERAGASFQPTLLKLSLEPRLGTIRNILQKQHRRTGM